MSIQYTPVYTDFTTMTASINSLNESVIELIERYGDCIVNDSNRQNTEENFQELASYILQFSRQIESNKTREKIFQEFVELIDSTSEELDEKQTIKDFTEQITSIEDPFLNPNKCERYLKFLEKISHSNVEEDDEIKTVSETVNLIDPISKLLIVEPVKNKVCGHVYEKSTILQFISKNHRTKCPIAGCNAVDYVKKSDLVEDNSLKRLIKSVK